jgi:hypothetical protein
MNEYSQVVPLVIAHRGLCSILPENIIFHDDYLLDLTDIDQFSQFADRKRLDFHDGIEKLDFWVEDFTLT